MSSNISISDNVVVITPKDLTAEWNTIEFLQAAEEHIAAGRTEFVADLSQLRLLNSVGLSLLISILTRARNAGGELALCGVQDSVSRLLVLTKLRSVFSVYESVEAAVQALSTESSKV